MPLLRKKPFVPIDLPPDLKADEEVFLNVLTKEIFRDYEEYFRRSILCNSLVWSCEYTGRSNLTLSEALQSEADAAEHLRKMPVVIQQAICFIIHKNEIASLTSFVDEVLNFYRTRFLIGEKVEIASTDKGSSRKEGIITDIMVNPDAAFHHPNQIVYKCCIVGTSDHVSVTGNKLCRAKTLLTRERVKLLAKCSAKKVSTDPPLYGIKPEYVTKLRLDDENFNIPYLADYGKSVPKVNNKRKNRDGDEEERKKSRKLKKKLENGDASKVDGDIKEKTWISPEERRRQVEEEKARKRKERQEERDNQKKLQTAEQLFQKEWMKPREDLSLTDSKELPLIPPVETSLPVSLFGEVIQVSEFFHLFGDHVDLEEEFPNGVQIGALEKSLINNKQEGMFGDLVNFLLKLCFALLEEEDEEEEKLAQRYNFAYSAPSLDLSQVTMLPSVTWHTAVETKEDDTLPWMGAAQALYFTDYYLGTPLHKIQLDSYTVTEVLRLHLLGAGGRVNGANYYGRWRFNHRGMFSDHDDPCIELRNRDPSILRMLTISNVFDLPPASKLTILSTLINEVLTFAQFREIIEEAVDGSRDAKKEWKSFGSEIQKKEKEEAASRYREWIASRIKIKEDKKKKKKGRLSELQGKDVDTTLESDRSMAETETDVSMAAENEEETKPSDKTTEEREEERKLNELQEHNFYIAFREISCKMKVNPLGMDRYFRKYWSFHSVPGIFVEESSLDIRTLYPDGLVKKDVNSKELLNGQYQLTSASQLHYDMKTNGIKEEDIINEGEYFVNQTTSLPVPGDKTAGGLAKQPNIISIIDPVSMTMEEIIQLKLREATQKHGETPVTYAKLCSTPGFKLLTRDQSSWCHLRTDTEIRDLVKSMNPRGEREKDLIDNINNDLNRIVNDIEIVPPLHRCDPNEDSGEQTPDEDETEEQKTARQILKKTSSEKLIEASLREQICDLENRIFEANFGSVKVKNRMAWRQEIEDFWLDDSVKCKITEGDVPEIPKPIVHQRLMALRASQQSNQSAEDDASSLTSGSSTVVSRRSIILKLTQAILSVEKGVPAKYLTFPLGDNPVGRAKSGAQSYKIEGEVDQISRWRESLAACTSLSQILLHISTFDSSIMWSKSILKTNCRICRRKSDPNKILLCDGCDRGQHLYCMKPKLKSIPPGKWFCSACKPNTRTARTRKVKIVEVSSEEEDEEEDEDKEEEGDSENEEESEDENEGSGEQLPRTRSKRKNAPTSNQPSKNVPLADKLKLCQQIVKIMQEDENGWPFLYPVDGAQIPDYYKIIPNPMDLSTVEKKLKSNRYRKLDTFIEDVNQIFLNCQHYNQSRAPAYKAGVRLQKLFTKKVTEFGLN